MGLGDEQEKGKDGEEENELLERAVEVDEFSVITNKSFVCNFALLLDTVPWCRWHLLVLMFLRSSQARFPCGD